jgi:hypothetical protein
VSGAPVYESDADAAPDEAYEAGTLTHLVPGNRGRLLDARRTPIVVRGVLAGVGMFDVEIAAFEDAGAHWQIELEQIDRYQFEPGQPHLDQAAVSQLEAMVRRLNARTEIACRESDRRVTLERIDASRPAARRHLSAGPMDALGSYMAELGLEGMESAFADQFVSNPGSGELVKGHAMTLAHLGLCPYEGKVQRAPDLFDEPWSRQRRGEHIVSRLAFVRELYQSLGEEHVVLYRGTSSEGQLDPFRRGSFVSATFDLRVARAHFEGGPRSVSAMLIRRLVPVERLFMTHVETRAMNRRFRESEAVVIGDPDDPLL